MSMVGRDSTEKSIVGSTLSFLLLNLVITTSDPKDTYMYMNCPDVTLRCTKSNLYHAVFISTCNLFNPFSCSLFYHCTAYTVYFHWLHVRLLRVIVNITQSINQSCCRPRQSLTITVVNCSGRASELGGIVNLVDRRRSSLNSGLIPGQNDDPVTRTWKMTQMTNWPGDPMTQFHVCCRPIPISAACARAQQQTRRTLLLLSIIGTDKQTDGHPTVTRTMQRMLRGQCR